MKNLLLLIMMIMMSLEAKPLCEVNITVSPNDTVCRKSILTFTADDESEGDITYIWKKGSSTLQYGKKAIFMSNSLVNGDSIYCIIYDGNCVDTSNYIKLRIFPVVNASISITAAPTTNLCYGDSVRFTAVSKYGGTPVYAWYRSDTLISGATSNSYKTDTAKHLNNYRCRMISDLTCVTAASDTSFSNRIEILATTKVTPIVTIVPSPNDTINENTNITFSCIKVNMGSVPTYKWHRINKDGNTTAVGTKATLTITDEDADIDSVQVYNVMGSSMRCKTVATDTSNVVRIRVID